MEAVKERGVSSWQLDRTHSEVGFSVRHLMVTNVKGQFPRFAADVELNESDLTRSKVSVVIDVDSVDTRAEQRDQHLRSADFFDASNYPKMTFTSRRIERAGDDRYRVIGDLTIRGITRETVLDAEVNGPTKDPWGGERIGIAASTKVDRREFGLVWNQALETGGIAVGNDVKISLELELIRS
jgi:polyisoprenoid-binding protein YceI